MSTEICSSQLPLTWYTPDMNKKSPRTLCYYIGLGKFTTEAETRREKEYHPFKKEKLILEKVKRQVKKPCSMKSLWHRTLPFKVTLSVCVLQLEGAPLGLIALSGWGWGWGEGNGSVLWLEAVITFTKLVIIGNFAALNRGLCLERSPFQLLDTRQNFQHPFYRDCKD